MCQKYWHTLFFIFSIKDVYTQSFMDRYYFLYLSTCC